MDPRLYHSSFLQMADTHSMLFALLVESVQQFMIVSYMRDLELCICTDNRKEITNPHFSFLHC